MKTVDFKTTIILFWSLVSGLHFYYDIVETP